MTCYKERGKWRYEFQRMGKRYRSGYYNTKAEARAAREEHRTKIKKEMEAIKKTAMGFLQLSEEYLDYWERRSQDEQRRKLTKKNFLCISLFLLSWVRI